VLLAAQYPGTTYGTSHLPATYTGYVRPIEIEIIHVLRTPCRAAIVEKISVLALRPIFLRP